MADRLSASFNIYNDNSYLNGLEIYDYQFPIPELKEIRESVPFMDGDYDFTLMYGAPVYHNRTIIINARTYINNYKEKVNYLTMLSRWLIGKPIDTFKCDFAENLEYYMKCILIEPKFTAIGIDFRIVFEGKPRCKNLITNEMVI
ncbi:hypothetical protein [Macrococcoides caseolyticum]|uniref:hypothetical protein n=1 Tax=Macrococcoides caseolyticum TaxID=69966 RepID=UPI000C328D15|nr:hypothetical protein [Macrococcus caseolyticus]PKE64210.1 hypothetical protein CW683_01150 [Macrococcus caseolyticus]